MTRDRSLISGHWFHTSVWTNMMSVFYQLQTAFYLQVERFVLPFQSCGDGWGFHLSGRKHLKALLTSKLSFHRWTCRFLHKAAHRDAFSVRYSRTSCNLAEEGNWRFCGTWLHAAQFFWKQRTAGYTCAAGCTKKRLNKPFVQLQTCRCRVHPHH